MQALPIDEVVAEILEHVRVCSRVVVEAPPGAGKSTRIPLSLLPLLAPDQSVWVSEPRRLAARLLATRVSEELGEPVGGTVGYAVRFERKLTRKTRLVYATTGVLLNELLAARGANAGLPSHIGCVVLDEVHERSLETDLLLALLVRELKSRPSFKLVVMSATLDAAPIAELLSVGAPLPCPRVQSAGRMFPVQLQHETTPDDRPLERRIVSAVRHHVQSGPAGHVLVFLPGAREIRLAAQALEPLAREAGVQVLPLHGDLDLAAQGRAVAPSSERKVVLSTNVAESSVTVPGTTGVIDSGLARVARHSPWTGLGSLKLEPISRASAEQRAGRAGRTAPGLVQRLYSASDLSRRPAYETPEILRSDLTELVLRLASAGLGVADLAWLAAPPEAALEEASGLLRRLGALDDQPGLWRITQVGLAMSRLPLSPRLSRVLLAAEELGVAQTGALACALLSERDLLTRDYAASHDQRIDAAGDSDVGERIERYRHAKLEGFRPHVCRSLNLSPSVARSVERAERQLLQLLRNPADTCPMAEVDQQLSRALLLGYSDRVAGRRRSGSRELTFYAGQTGRLSEQSVVHQAPLVIALEVADRRTQGPEVTLACAIDEGWVFEHFSGEFSDREELTFNPDTARVERISRMYYGSVCLEERRAAAPASAEAARVLTEWLKQRGLSSVDPKDRLGELAARLQLLSEHFPELSNPQTRESLLELCLSGAPNLSELKAQDLEQLALSRLPAEIVSALYRETPSEIQLGGGRRAQVHYTGGAGPWLESFLQDFFGSLDTPRICSKRVPLTLHLLAPNRRALQVTQDLAGFWQRAYPELRRQLSRRYPRHAWPEDGATAVPPPPRPPRRR